MKSDIKKFKNKKLVFDYLVSLFSEKGKVILIRGSTAKSSVKKFSDFDAEVYQDKLENPYYEIVFVKDKPVLITVYFYKYKKGNPSKIPENVKVIYGNYNDLIEPDFSKDKYNYQEKIKRECQLIVDNFFNYLRNKNIDNLDFIQKKIK